MGENLNINCGWGMGLTTKTSKVQIPEGCPGDLEVLN